MVEAKDLSIVIPALNEETTVGICIKKALKAFKKLGISGEVVIADNGSTDGTRDLSEKLGARVVRVPKKGYGNAIMGGVRAAHGTFIIMGDADDSYNFEEIDGYYRKLKEGSEFVIGNRFRGKIEEGAMPLLHRFLGTPVLTAIMNLFFGTGIGDTNCGMRGFTKKGFGRMRLKTGGMEFATEMVIKASLVGLNIAEVPCNLYRDKRERKPHLNTWNDGWRHLRFMLLFTPTWTFLVPGTAAALLGLLGLCFLTLRDFLLPEAFPWLPVKHMVSFMVIFLTGSYVILLGVTAKAFTFSRHFDYASKVIRWLNYFSLEKGIVCGLLLVAFAMGLLGFLVLAYFADGFPVLSEQLRFILGTWGVTLLLTGVQFIFGSFLLSLFYLDIK